MNASSAPRILVIISQFYPIRGGAESQAWMLARLLARRGAKVTVLTLAQLNLPEDETVEGVRILRALKPLALGPLWGVTYARQVRKWMRDLRDEYDIVHTHQVYIHTSAAATAARELGKRVICTIVCGGEWSDFRRLREVRGGERYLRQAFQADRMIAVSNDLAREAVEAGYPRERVAVIPYMVDVEHFIPCDAPRDPNELVFIGRLHEQKNVPVLIEAFAMFARDRADLKLRLVGDGPEHARLEEFAREKGLAGRVAFEGYRKNIRPYLQRAALVVSATRAEGMSNAMLEAMACGAPIVATRAQGNAELFEVPELQNDEIGKDFLIGRCGILVTREGFAPLAHAITHALDNPDLRLKVSLAARAAALEKYSPDRVLNEFLALVDELTYSHPPLRASASPRENKQNEKP